MTLFLIWIWQIFQFGYILPLMHDYSLKGHDLQATSLMLVMEVPVQK